MERNTNKQLATKLTALANQLVQDGDAFADANVSAAVAALEQSIISPRREFERHADMNVADANLKLLPSMNLSAVVAQIKATTAPGQPLSERFRGLVAQHDKTRCIAAIVFEDLWNGSTGWKPSKVLWDMVVYVWRNAPDFFSDYDSDLEIVEDHSEWTQRYFDDQRNSLRFNFCLKRLCHLVMVYDYLHGAEATVKKPSPASYAPPSSNRYGYGNTSHPSKSSRSVFVCLAVVVCVVLSVAACLFGTRKGNSKDPPNTTPAQTEPLKASSAQSSSNQVQVCQTMPEKPAAVLNGMPAQIEAQKQVAQSNEVVKTTIALQDVAPQALKAPVLRPGNVANAGNDTNEQ